MTTSLTSSRPLRGALRPRVEVRPQVEIIHDRADAVIELMRRANKPLLPWQEDAVRLMTSVRPDGKWACFEYCEWCSRQNGKGAVLEARALGGLLLFEEELIMWSAHEVKTALEAFRRVRSLLFALGDRVNDNLIVLRAEDPADDIHIKINNANGDEGFERLDTGQRIRFIARSKSSGRGFSGDVNIIDETFAYSDEQHDALMPTMNARVNPQIIYTSSPPLDAASGDVMFALKKRAEAGGDDSLGYRDWGNEGDLDRLDEIDLDDLELAASANPTLGLLITEETLRRNRRSLSMRGYAREVLGLWPIRLDGGTAVDMKLWAQRADENSAPIDPVALAIEVNNGRGSAYIGIAGRREDGDIHMEVIKSGSGVSWVVDAVVTLNDLWGPCVIVLDDKSEAASLLPDLKERGLKVRPRNAETLPLDDEIVVTTWANDVARAAGALYDGVSDKDETKRNIWHLDQPELNESLRGAVWRALSDARAWSRKDALTNPGPLMVITLALHGLLTYGPELETNEVEGALMS